MMIEFTLDNEHNQMLSVALDEIRVVMSCPSDEDKTHIFLKSEEPSRYRILDERYNVVMMRIRSAEDKEEKQS